MNKWQTALDSLPIASRVLRNYIKFINSEEVCEFMLPEKREWKRFEAQRFEALWWEEAEEPDLFDRALVSSMLDKAYSVLAKQIRWTSRLRQAVSLGEELRVLNQLIKQEM